MFTGNNTIGSHTMNLIQGWVLSIKIENMGELFSLKREKEEQSVTEGNHLLGSKSYFRSAY